MPTSKAITLYCVSASLKIESVPATVVSDPYSDAPVAQTSEFSNYFGRAGSRYFLSGGFSSSAKGAVEFLKKRELSQINNYLGSIATCKEKMNKLDNVLRNYKEEKQ